MLKLSPLEIFTRGLPEAFIFILAAYAFSKRFVDIKKYILSSLLFVTMVYTIRLLPIHYGVHTILNVFVLIIISVNISKIDLISSIRSSIVAIILQFVCEGINVLIIQYIFNANANYVFNNPVLKTLYGIPSILIFACITLAHYIRLFRRKELKYT